MARTGFGIAAVLWAGGCFGIFLAWSCTVLWGLDAIDPRVAIPAMNEGVRNGVFAFVFFGAPFVILAAGLQAFRAGRRGAGAAYLASALIFALGMIGWTVAFLLPLNEGFATLPVAGDLREATRLWSAYSDPWQQLNYARTAFCGLGLVLATVGTMQR
ncbi:MAG: anthrone oxygenase family protein [Planktomarina sp.]